MGRKKWLTGILAASLSLALAAPMTAQAAVSKQESVYVIANPDGSTKSVTVSDQLRGAGSVSGTLKDVSSLSDIKNVKGDETFDQSGENLTWNTAGEDIFYQGKTDKALPVSMNLQYELDGVKGDPKDFVGKSGKMKITLSYENKSFVKEEIGGETKEIATPFLMATGFIMDGETFSNIKISNGGKVIDDGSKSIVIFIGLPGLKESLDLSSDIGKKIADKLNTEFTLECDTQNFEMKNTFTFASANLVNDVMENEEGEEVIDLKKIDNKVDDLKKAVNKLSDGTGSLKDGVKKLDKGADKLVSGLKTYATDGVKKLTAGIRQLGENAPKLKKGIGDYTDGVDTFAKGAKAYVTGSGKLTSGIKTFTGALDKIDLTQFTPMIENLTKFMEMLSGSDAGSGLAALSQGATAVDNGIKTVNQGLTTLKDSYSNNDAAITGLETALAANEQVLAGLKAAQAAGTQGLDSAIATLEQTTAGEKKAIEGLKAATTAQKSGITQLETATSATGDLGAGASQLSTGITTATSALSTMSDPTTMARIRVIISALIAKIPDMTKGIKQLKEGAEKLAANDKKLLEGADKLTEASKTVRSSVDKLGDGMTQLTDGAGKLDDATDKLLDGAGELGDGTGKLLDGCIKLDDGFSKFREKAIDKILNMYDNDIKTFVDRLEAIMDAGREYKSFSGISDDMDGEVKFIIETEAVKADD